MCGIAGIVAYREAPRIDRGELLGIRDAMRSRGPDGQGLWLSADDRAGLVHRRLAIIDLSDAGAQPMASADGRLRITFNGEIYNYKQLRADLVAKGHRFRSNSDTEVLLHLYAERGAAMVHALRGMYAFGIWDEAEKTLFLARDPFGIKPIYYADNGTTLRFASQVKALVAGGRIDTAPEPAGHVGFFVMGSVPEPFTMYRSVRALPAGTTLTLRRDSGPRLARFFSVPEELARAAAQATPMDNVTRGELLRDKLRESVGRHMVADVPVGLFLSSGIDSSTIAALACEAQGGNLHSVTLGFAEYQGNARDETPLAAETARHLGTRHETKWITREAFQAEYARVLSAMDQPSIDGVNTYFVSKAAAEAGMKVALSGLGGDELFGGYPSFRDVPRLSRLFGFARDWHKTGALLRKLSAPALALVSSPKFASLFEYGGSIPGAYLLRRALYLPWELREFMDPDLFADGCAELDLVARLRESIEGLSNNRQKVTSLESSWYMRNQLLRDADWAGMAHSLEIRVPFVDVELFGAVAAMIASGKPPGKRDAAAAPSRPLPAALLARRKTGFSIPVDEWAKHTRLVRGPQRQLRNWAHIVHRPYKKVRTLALLSDAFGGHGGIALYNRDLLTSLCSMPECGEVVALPRLMAPSAQAVPERLTYRGDAANSKWSYVRVLAKLLWGDTRFDLVLCCHINLLSLAVLAKARARAPLVMFLYGIEAWRPHPLKRALLARVDRFVSISDVTRTKFIAWSEVNERKIAIVPNAIHGEWYGLRPRNALLVERYGLEGKTVIMTLGRLVSSERYKGFDEVLEVMSSLLAEMPDLVYLVVGEGSDRGRLERKAADLGISAHVRFTGGISEEEKADHYRIAHAYVMPSRGEGFGFVLLEAMACGVPAVGSTADGGREALRDGRLGILVDPADPSDVRRGIREALRRGAGPPPDGLEFFDFDNFRMRVWALIREAVRPPDFDRQAA